MKRGKKLISKSAIFVVIFSLFSVFALGQMTITYRPGSTEEDTRYEYETNLLKLALEKTKEEYGEYELKKSPPMNTARAIQQVSKDSYENFFVRFSYEQKFSEDMDMSYVPLPIHLGIVGYRVAFTSPEIAEQLKDVETLEDLKEYKIGQGRGWSDVEILRNSGFEVMTVNEYERLFKMAAQNRFDLFFRGANELLSEYNAHKDMENLTYDKNVAVYYPLPRFFYTHKSNKKAYERIKKGLMAAYKDGSLEKLWKENYNESLEFVKLGERKIFEIENPLLEELDFDYEQYFYEPNAE